jgi:hypothetical protein
MIIIENDKGETREIKSGETFMAPWRVKTTLNNMKREEAKNAMMQKFTAAAADFGLPAHVFQRVGGFLLGCMKCTATGEITDLYYAGKITKEEHRDLFIQAANAFDQDDQETLKKIKGKLEALRAQSKGVPLLNVSDETDTWNKMALKISQEERERLRKSK